MPSTRAGVPKPPCASLVAGGWTYLENPLYGSRLCALVLAQGINVGGRDQTKITGCQRFEPIRIDPRRLKLWQWIPALSINCPAAPPRTPRNFHCACGGGDAPGRTLLAPVAGQVRSPSSAPPQPWSSAAKLHPIERKDNFLLLINVSFPSGCVVCKTKPKYSNSSMGLIETSEHVRELNCERVTDRLCNAT